MNVTSVYWLTCLKLLLVKQSLWFVYAGNPYSGSTNCDGDIFIIGGVEHMGHVGMISTLTQKHLNTMQKHLTWYCWNVRSHERHYAWRTRCVESHRRAWAATQEGRFKKLALKVTMRMALKSFATLNPSRCKPWSVQSIKTCVWGGSVTAATSSALSDGASALCLLNVLKH